MADDVLLELNGSFEQIFRINSGGIRFKVKGNYCQLYLVAQEKPHAEIYQVLIGPITQIINIESNEEIHGATPDVINNLEYKRLWISWSNNMVRIGQAESNRAFIQYLAGQNGVRNNQIGFIKVCNSEMNLNNIQMEIEAPPFLPKNCEIKMIEGGELRWVEMSNNVLPLDAMVGGFEQEPSYIARALHNNSLCPGKFLLSRGAAFVPWGFREHRKENYEILCGYNAAWVKTKSNLIPENAFIAGYSEVRHEPLYIGRAMHKNRLLTGKVHALYKTCYLPYNGKEVEVGTYEILVQPNVPHRGEFYYE